MNVIDWLMQPADQMPGGMPGVWAAAVVLGYPLVTMVNHSRNVRSSRTAGVTLPCAVCGGDSHGHAIGRSGRAWCAGCWPKVQKTAQAAS